MTVTLVCYCQRTVCALCTDRLYYQGQGNMWLDMRLLTETILQTPEPHQGSITETGHLQINSTYISTEQHACLLETNQKATNASSRLQI